MSNAQKLSPFGPALCAILCEWAVSGGGTAIVFSRPSNGRVRVSIGNKQVSADFYVSEIEARDALSQERYAIKARQMIAALEKS